LVLLRSRKLSVSLCVFRALTLIILYSQDQIEFHYASFHLRVTMIAFVESIKYLFAFSSFIRLIMLLIIVDSSNFNRKVILNA
jgi:hypothetical protein